jgi:uncharacterized protein YecE (DUF72 family)
MYVDARQLLLARLRAHEVIQRVAVIGTAGWTIPRDHSGDFPKTGTHLERYSARLQGVEINSSFYRSHKRVTYERWASSVPADFRFSVKLPRTITQIHRLQNVDGLIDAFWEEANGLGNKLAIVLIQLPPSLRYDGEVAERFFKRVKTNSFRLACEPRHASWFSSEPELMLRRLQISRVAADPPRADTDGSPGGDDRVAYYRLHGSPKIYYSNYPKERLWDLAGKLRPYDWCIFDNTAAFHAIENAITLKRLLPNRSRPIVRS